MADQIAGGVHAVPQRFVDLNDGAFAQAVNARAIAAVVDAPIANTASLSAAISLGAGRLAAILLPASMDGTRMTFQASLDGTNFFDVYDETGAEVSYLIGSSRIMRVPLTDWLGFAAIKIRTGTSASPTTQTGARAIKLLTVL